MGACASGDRPQLARKLSLRICLSFEVGAADELFGVADCKLRQRRSLTQSVESYGILASDFSCQFGWQGVYEVSHRAQPISRLLAVKMV